jgi:predicted exporter
VRTSGSNARPLALGWLLLVALVVLLALHQGPAFDSSILNLLPESEQDPLQQLASDQMSREFSERLLLVLSGSDDAALRKSVSTMATALQELAEVESVDWRVEAREVASLRGEQYPYRFVLLDEGLRERLRRGEFGYLRERALARLYSPLAGADSLLEDPFGFYFELDLQRQSHLRVQISDSLLALTDAPIPSYLLVVTLAQDPFSPALQQRLLTRLEQLRQQLSPGISKLAMSGMLLHAAAGASQAKREISTIGVGSLVGIALIMLVVFRRLRPLLLLLFPVATGCLFASAASLLIFERVHLVTFAFGAGLVGVSVDYALHFLCERQVLAAPAVLRRIMPGLLLGLFSSVAAYAAQAMTPFPGLRQMAVFSVLGLGTAWLTVVLWLPLLTAGGPLQPLPLAASLAKLRNRFPRLERNRPLLALLVLVLLLAGLSIWQSVPQDDIRLLQTSPPELLEQERALHQLLGSSGGSRFLLVSADSLEACLQLEESMRPALLGLAQQGVIADFQMLSSSLPSMERQAENVALVEALYRSELQPLFNSIKLSPAHLQAAQDALTRALPNRIDADAWRQLTANAAEHHLLVSDDGSAAATAIRFSGELSPEATARLRELASGMPGVRLIDRVQTLSALLGKYRVQITGWVLLAYLVVLVALALRYRFQLWRIVLPPLAASIITLAILVELQQGINLFHLMALILVLGIGLDMGIFLAETGEAAHTWLAVSLSAFTSLLAFGLLAVSATPVLHHFGLTVAIGLALVWLLAPMARRQ